MRRSILLFIIFSAALLLAACGSSETKGMADAHGVAREAGYLGDLADFEAEIAIYADASSAWHSGDGIPREDIGEEGEYYLSTDSLGIYKVIGGKWILLYTLGAEPSVTVIFNSAGAPETPENIKTTRESAISLPKLERLGFKFLGWFYKDGEVEMKFTDGEAVKKSMLLTAKWERGCVYYENFGAVGDGETNDFAAIYETHTYANANKLTVKAKDGAKYYVKSTRVDGSVVTVPIMTNVEWGDAEFYIDDSNLDYLNPEQAPMTDIDIFTVKSEYEITKITSADVLEKVGSIKPGDERINLALGYDALITVYYKTNRMFRRYGESCPLSDREGQEQKEILLVDVVGSVDASTPITFYYPSVSKIEVARIDKTPLTVSGGIFTTYACALDAKSAAGNFDTYKRGICITRSNVTLDGIRHNVEGEVTLEMQAKGQEGAAYRGFYCIEGASNVTMRNCTLTGRRYYGNGTYDFCAVGAASVTLDGCRQTNFFIDDNGHASETETEYSSLRTVKVGTKSMQYCWGVSKTDFCKNLSFVNSTLSRVDSHAGHHNGSIINSRINMITISGFGDFLVENTHWYASEDNLSGHSIINLRPDYGSSWNGEITLKNLTAHVKDAALYLIYNVYNNWNFGYECHIPDLDVDGLTVVGADGEAEAGYTVHLLTTSKSLDAEPNLHRKTTLNTHPVRDAASLAPDTESYENLNPVVAPTRITFKPNGKGYRIRVPRHSFFAETEFTDGQNRYTGTDHGADTTTFIFD